MNCVAEPGCERPVKYRLLGWCGMHYSRNYRTGSTKRAILDHSDGALCAVDGCKRVAEDREWCRSHYQRWWRGNDVGPPGPLIGGIPPSTCTMPGCDKPHRIRGWCNAHHMLWRMFGDPLGSGYPGGRLGPEKRARYLEVTPLVRADLRMAHTMREHGRRMDVAFYLDRAASHGRPLTRVEQAYADGLRMTSNRQRDRAVLRGHVMRLTAKGLGAKEIGRRLGVSDRTVVRYRTQAQELEKLQCVAAVSR